MQEIDFIKKEKTKRKQKEKEKNAYQSIRTELYDELNMGMNLKSLNHGMTAI